MSEPTKLELLRDSLLRTGMVVEDMRKAYPDDGGSYSEMLVWIALDIQHAVERVEDEIKVERRSKTQNTGEVVNG